MNDARCGTCPRCSQDPPGRCQESPPMQTHSFFDIDQAIRRRLMDDQTPSSLTAKKVRAAVQAIRDGAGVHNSPEAHNAFYGTASPCPIRSEPWDVAATMPCQKPLGHSGNHAYSVEWDDSGEFV